MTAYRSALLRAKRRNRVINFGNRHIIDGVTRGSDTGTFSVVVCLYGQGYVMRDVQLTSARAHGDVPQCRKVSGSLMNAITHIHTSFHAPSPLSGLFFCETVW